MGIDFDKETKVVLLLYSRPEVTTITSSLGTDGMTFEKIRDLKLV